MIEPTPEQQAAICAELALRMGWRCVRSAWLAEDDNEIWLSPDSTEGDGEGNEACDDPPNPFTSADDSQALLLWLATQSDAVWNRFVDILLPELAHFAGLGHYDYRRFPSEAEEKVDYHFGKAAKVLMTAPLPVIAMAAHAAIRENAK